MKEYALTFARIVLGLAALVRGISDTFGVWGGPHLGRVASDAAASTGVSQDWLFYVVSIGLMIVGAALLLGIMVKAGAFVVLVITVWHGIVHSGFRAYFVESGGCEYLLALAALCCVVATHGPGAYRIELRRKKG
jgi:uncharacterized membrane protein YphA (DoxX/SURF4 family)